MNIQNTYPKNRKYRFKKWEISLLLSLCITLCAGVWAGAQQRDLSSKLVRLHVIAKSDSAEDQAIKLQVRDEILSAVTPALKDANNPEKAQEVINDMLPELEDIASSVSKEAKVEATLSLENYPTREYTDFSLPAGEYMSLRVILGEGEGQNWWCVVFPPLCMSAVEESSTEAYDLTQEDVSLITEDGEGYIFKFKLMEMIGGLQEKLG